MEELAERAASGDPDALGELWRSHQHLLLRYFRGKGMDDPEDLASIVWLEVARNLHRFKGGATDFRRWLFTIAARRRVDEIRKRNRSKGNAGRAALAPQPRSTDEEFERAESLERALARIRTLPPDQAEAVLLRIVADLDVADVAAVMGRSQGSVRVLVHRGLKRLADQGDGNEGRGQVEAEPPRTISAPGVTAGVARSMYAS